MASTSDPRASGFNPAQFRDAIKFAMNMGAPEDTAERVTFKWTTRRTYANADPHGNAYNRKATPVSVEAHDDVQVDCAVEFIPRASIGSGTPVGEFETPRAVITVLDEDYPSVDGADHVLMGGNRYNIDYVQPPVGLFAVTIYQIHVSAESES